MSPRDSVSRAIITTLAIGGRAFYLPGIEISKDDDAFIPRRGNRILVRPAPPAPLIPVPMWLIEWSKSRDLFLSLAENPWVFRPN